MQIGVQMLFQGRPDMSDAEVYQRELKMALEAEALGPWNTTSSTTR
jgi:hypothetical protein